MGRKRAQQKRNGEKSQLTVHTMLTVPPLAVVATWVMVTEFTLTLEI